MIRTSKLGRLAELQIFVYSLDFRKLYFIMGHLLALDMSLAWNGRSQRAMHPWLAGLLFKQLNRFRLSYKLNLFDIAFAVSFNCFCLF